MCTNNEQTGLEGNRHGTRDQDVVTEHMDGSGRRDGDSTLRTAS